MAADRTPLVLLARPCTPNEAGICLDLVKASSTIPLSRLSRAAVDGQSSAANVVRAPAPCMASSPRSRIRARRVAINGHSRRRAITAGGPIGHPAGRARRHRRSDRLVWARAQTLPVPRRAIPPRSIASEHGHLILKNFLELAAAWNQATGRRDKHTEERHGRLQGAPSAKVRPARRSPARSPPAAFDIMMSARRRPRDGWLADGLRPAGRRDPSTPPGDRQDDQGRRRPPGAIDVVGRGPMPSGSYNISTCAAFIVAGAGIPGRQARQPRASPRAQARPTCSARRRAHRICAGRDHALHLRAGIGFMFAPAHHPAMKHVGTARIRARHAHDLQPASAFVESAGVKRRWSAFSRASGSSRSPTCSRMGSERAYVVTARRLDEITSGGRPPSRRWETAR